jgi:hypothetical protein
LVAAALGDLRQAERLLRTASVLFEETEDGPGARGTLNNLGFVLLDAGDEAGARQALEQSWRDMPEVPVFQLQLSWGLVAMAGLERRNGREGPAERRLAEARRRFTEIGDERDLEYLSSRS